MASGEASHSSGSLVHRPKKMCSNPSRLTIDGGEGMPAQEGLVRRTDRPPRHGRGAMARGPEWGQFLWLNHAGTRADPFLVSAEVIIAGQLSLNIA